MLKHFYPIQAFLLIAGWTLGIASLLVPISETSVMLLGASLGCFASGYARARIQEQAQNN